MHGSCTAAALVWDTYSLTAKRDIDFNSYALEPEEATHLLLLAVAEGGPDDGEEGDPHVRRERVVAARRLPQGPRPLPHLQLACAGTRTQRLRR